MPMQKEYINWAPLQGMLARRNQQDEAEQQSRAEQGMAMGQQALQALLSSMSESEQAKRDRENREFQMNLHRMGTDERREENNATRAYEAAKWRQEQENRKAEKEAELKRRQIDDENERNRYEQSNMLGRNQLHWQRQYQQQQIELEKQRIAEARRWHQAETTRKGESSANGNPGAQAAIKIALDKARAAELRVKQYGNFVEQQMPGGKGNLDDAKREAAEAYEEAARAAASMGYNDVAQESARKAQEVRSSGSQNQPGSSSFAQRVQGMGGLKKKEQ